ncbi:hypothetical protein UlMin_022140 [Ulmus minor]
MARINPSLPLCTFLFFFFFFNHGVSQSLQDQEQTVLLRIKQYWGNLPFMDSWNPSSSSHCSWPGIVCTANSVTGLSLVNINIIATVPPFICDMKNLTDLNLGDNFIPGEFPRVLFNCSKLQTLDLSENYFVGLLPEDIDRLSLLRSLILRGNNFTGDIPDSIGRLQELRELQLSANQFNGFLPPEIGNLSNLETLKLDYNTVLQPSTLPSEYTQLKKLKIFYAYKSNLIGEIPERMGDMAALEELDIQQNSLTGKIPEGLFTLKNLSRLLLSRNKLSGEMPKVVEALNLRLIDLSDNNLSGSVPKDFEKLTKMTGLALFSNNLTGDFPEGIGRLPELIDVNIRSNNLSGELSPDFGRISQLRDFQVASNNFTGKLPKHLCSQGNLIGLAAFDNNLEGELPESLGNCKTLRLCRVENNMLSGEVPSGLWTSFNLTELMLSNNKFTGELPEKMARNLSRLQISNNKFSGKIPTQVSSWTNLIVFEARNNLLTGNIPQELTTLRLTNLLLDQNQLTGDLPSDIVSWQRLNTLNLNRNQLSGQIPEELGQLPVLTTLDLSVNQFSGPIPSQLASLKLNFLNLSSNKLIGTIPTEFENSNYADSFLNNPGLCSNNGDINLNLCNAKPQQPNKLSSQHLALIITLCIAVFLAALCFSYYIIRCYWSKHGLDSTWKLTSFQRLNFTESNIVSGLADQNLIGSGGSGKVYRVPVNHQGDIVAVKRIWNSWKLEDKLEQEFVAEVKILSSIRHTNIVKLLCCISSENSKLLVYEYLENRSLDRWLHSKNRQFTVPITSSVHDIILDWPRRLQIAVGAAQGLCYMHHDCVPPVIHRDIKSSNILLDSDFNAKIADFGLAKLLVKQGELATMSTVAGSFGYMAPEYAHTTRVNEKIDVYSFGVILLELATGREANNGEENTSITEWAWRHIQEGKPVVDIFDEEIKEPSYLDEMCSVFLLGIRCTEKSPSRRPSMKEVVYVLLRCNHPIANREKLAGLEYDAAPLLKNSKRERLLEDDDGGGLATNV